MPPEHTHACSLIIDITIFQNITMASRLSQEEENFVKLGRILWCDVLPKLRQLFKKEFWQKFRSMYADNWQSGDLFLRYVQKQPPCDVVRNAILKGDSEEFDCTTLCYCLLDSKALQLRSNEWKAIAGLRSVRNDLVHCSSNTLSKHELGKREHDLISIYHALNWSVTDLKKYAADPLQTAESVKVKEYLLKERKTEQRLKHLEGK